MAADIPTNLLYFGDNLTWLREHGKFPDESVDLVYLDPPFNSNRNYNVLFKESDVRESEAQIQGCIRSVLRGEPPVHARVMVHA